MPRSKKRCRVQTFEIENGRPIHTEFRLRDEMPCKNQVAFRRKSGILILPCLAICCEHVEALQLGKFPQDMNMIIFRTSRALEFVSKHLFLMPCS